MRRSTTTKRRCLVRRLNFEHLEARLPLTALWDSAATPTGLDTTNGFTDLGGGAYESPAAIRNAVATITDADVNNHIATGAGVTVTAQAPTVTAPNGRARFSNAFVVFDYADEMNYKLAGVEAKNRLWVISEMDGGQYRRLATRNDATITQTGSLPDDLTVEVREGSVTLQTRAGLGPLVVSQGSFAASGSLLNHPLGIGTVLAGSTFPKIMVEDFEPTVVEDRDFGDAPASYDRGVPASHLIVAGAPFLGTNAPDPEAGPLPTDSIAEGDDSVGVPDDEDGVTGAVYRATIPPSGDFTVTAQAGSYLDVWVDQDRDGEFDPTTDRVSFARLIPGTGTVSIPIPAITGNTFARFRVSNSAVALGPTGAGPAGEVEDHLVEFESSSARDFGDAPASYDVGIPASHLSGGPTLGTAIDTESGPRSSNNADGDDLHGTVPDDEDGVTDAEYTEGGMGNAFQVTTTTTAASYLDVWVDQNRDGEFDAGENISSRQLNRIGTFTQFISIPTITANTFARFRVSKSAVAHDPTGPGPEGEVEDHLVTFIPAQNRDFGDAPASYDAGSPASHLAAGLGGPVLGGVPDWESGPRSSNNADGDDLHGTRPDDEDGVDVPVFVQGATSNFIVTGTAGAILDAWVDENRNGQFDNDEIIATGLILDAGDNLIPFTPTQLGNTFARFRIWPTGVVRLVSPNGPAGSVGEVEDYLVRVEAGDVLFAQDFDTDASGLDPTTNFIRVGDAFQSPADVRYAVSTIIAPAINPLPGDVNMTTLVTMTPSDGAMLFSNAFVVFDYMDPMNYKLAGIEAKNRLWVISEVVAGDYHRVSSRTDANIGQSGTYTLNLDVRDDGGGGTEVSLQTLNGSLLANEAAFTNNRDLRSGALGVGTILASSTFDDIEVRRLT